MISLLLFIMGSGVLIIFIPAVFIRSETPGLTDVEESLKHATESAAFLNTLLINSIMCIPLTLDVILDSIWNRNYNNGYKIKTHFSRWMPVIIFGVPDIIMYLRGISPRYVNQVLTSQSIGALCYMLLALRCDDLGVWTKGSTLKLVAVTTFCGVIAFYTAIVSSQVFPLFVVMVILLIATILGGLIFFSSFCWIWQKRYPGWSSQSPEQFFCMIYMSQFVMYLLAQLLIWGIALRFSPTTLSTTRCLFIFITLSIVTSIFYSHVIYILSFYQEYSPRIIDFSKIEILTLQYLIVLNTKFCLSY